MRINNNVTAMNAHRMYSNNNTNVTKSVSKLSSGYRINSAADDAAGLAISEKMRAQIRGLTMASKNSQDAVSMVQTAEGALQETHNILQRMRELAVQSASDTNETSIDRNALNKEFQQLKKEIDDIADKTRFNDQNLIDGTFSSYKASASLEGTSATSVNRVMMGNARNGTYALSSVVRTVGAEAGAKPTFSTSKGKADNVATSSFTKITGELADNETVMFNKDFTVNFKEVDKNGVAYFEMVAQDGTKFTGTASIATGGTNAINIKFKDVGTLAITTSSKITIAAPSAGTIDLAAISLAAKGVDGMTITGLGGERKVEGTPKAYLKLGDEEVEVFAGDKEVEFRSAGVTLVLNSALTTTNLFGANGTGTNTVISTTGAVGAADMFGGSIKITETKGQSMVIQTGANEGDNLAINLDKMNTNMLGIYTTSIATREKASEAITFVNNATNIVSNQRAELGALSNRLEHKIANLDTSAENLQAAESRIRDVDMAQEMTKFTKNNILAQASTAMLAQANSLPQGVLQLLG